MSKADLKIDWATHAAAKYACEHWHYSQCLPPSKTAKLGVWEDGKFIGVIVYGVGATSGLCKAYGLKPDQGCELVRIALNSHKTHVSRIIAISLKFIRKTFKGLRLIVSFADPERGHHGGVYQASNWLFCGNTTRSDEYFYKGRRWQGRAFRHKYKGMENHPSVKKIKGSSKHRYLMPLDKEMRKQILPLSKPYPKRAQSIDADAPGYQSGEGGSTPTCALQSKKP